MSRGLIAGMLVLAAALAGYLVLGRGDDRYLVKLEMKNAGGLRNGANVRIGGAPVGRVTNVRVDDRDLAVADLRLEPGIAPIGAGASAVVDTDGIFGERFVSIDRGDLDDPQPSGSVIPTGRTMVSVRLDDVIDTLDLDTRRALGVFINEQGMAIAGRGRDLAAVLAALPPSLDRSAQLLDQFAADNQALGRLVDSSDAVVAEVADHRVDFGRVLGAFGETLDTLDSRRAELGETFRRAPATLQAARRTLVSLQSAAVPLIPAARGLRSTAAPLAGTLTELPAFAAAAVPALDTVEDVAPDLQRLADGATPVVRRLSPLARSLSSYTTQAFDPFTQLLDMGTPNLFGLMEGWARSTQGRDAASHIFRFGATSGSDIFAVLANPPVRAKRGKPERSQPQTTAPAPDAPAPAPAVQVPAEVRDVLDRLPVVPEALQKILGTKPLRDVAGKVERVPALQDVPKPLLDYLLGP